jgi:hypothetical protein
LLRIGFAMHLGKGQNHFTNDLALGGGELEEGVLSLDSGHVCESPHQPQNPALDA